jgi:hypothetical protein
MCLDNGTGYLYERSFNYTNNGIETLSTFRLDSLQAGGSPKVSPPLDLSGDAVSLLLQEREEQIKLATCVTTKSGDERDRCVAGEALSTRRADLCQMAGGRKDRCLVSLVPLLKDTTLCGMVSDASFKDDCYIELAGAYKDTAYCQSVKNSSKMALCQEAATPLPEDTAGQTGETQNGNATSGDDKPAAGGNQSGVNINDFLNYIDKADQNETAAGNGTSVDSSVNATE